jgi:hypothetical protein
MGISISASSAQRKMSINIEQRTWKGFVNMTESVENLLTVLQQLRMLQEHGERKIREEAMPTKLLLRLCDMELFLGSHAVDVETKKALLTMKTTTSH